MASSPKTSIWHWVTPILISVAVTVATILLTAGGSMARLDAVEKRGDKTDDKLEKISDKLDAVATKDDLKEFKTDVNERIREKQRK